MIKMPPFSAVSKISATGAPGSADNVETDASSGSALHSSLVKEFRDVSEGLWPLSRRVASRGGVGARWITVKAWLGRAALNTVRRGRQLTAVPWARWFPRSGAVADSRFQGPDEPFPGHWRSAPPPWPRELGPEFYQQLRLEVGALPELWARVLWERDVNHRAPVEVADQLGITMDQEQRILTQARAALRERLAELVARRGAS
jgi:DNA-directed RNA polymerase specialized sigma24 family protein